MQVPLKQRRWHPRVLQYRHSLVILRHRERHRELRARKQPAAPTLSALPMLVPNPSLCLGITMCFSINFENGVNESCFVLTFACGAISPKIRSVMAFPYCSPGRKGQSIASTSPAQLAVRIGPGTAITTITAAAAFFLWVLSPSPPPPDATAFMTDSIDSSHAPAPWFPKLPSSFAPAHTENQDNRCNAYQCVSISMPVCCECV